MRFSTILAILPTVVLMMGCQTIEEVSKKAQGAIETASSTVDGSMKPGCTQNDTFQCAKSLPLNSRVRGVAGARNKDYYQITLQQAQVLKFTLDPMPNKQYLDVQLYDSEYDRLHRRNFRAGQPGSFEVELNRPGTYYVYVYGGNRRNTESYVLTVEGQSSAPVVTGSNRTAPGRDVAKRLPAVKTSASHSTTSTSSSPSVSDASIEGAYWTSSGSSRGGRHEITALEAGPSGIAYVGTKQGLFRSADYGDTWTLTSLTDISIGGVLTGEGQVLYAVGVEGEGADSRNALYRSKDRGETWEALSLPEAVAASGAFEGGAVMPDGSLMLSYTSGGATLLRSPDQGMTWSQIETLAAGSIVSPAPGVLLLHEEAASSLYTSKDRGQSWTALSLSSKLPAEITEGWRGVEVHSIVMHPSGRIFANVEVETPGNNASYLISTADYGSTWTVVETNFGSVGWKKLWDASGDGTLYATAKAPAEALLYRSQDQGKNWTVFYSGLADPPANTNGRNVGVTVKHLAASPDGAVYASTSAGLYRSRQ